MSENKAEAESSFDSVELVRQERDRDYRYDEPPEPCQTCLANQRLFLGLMRIGRGRYDYIDSHSTTEDKELALNRQLDHLSKKGLRFDSHYYKHIKLEDFGEPPQKEKAATLSEWFDERIKFAEKEKKADDDAGDALGERYWHGVVVAYMGSKQKVSQENRELLEQIKAQVQALKTGIVSPGYITACNDIVALLDKMMEADAS